MNNAEFAARVLALVPRQRVARPGTAVYAGRAIGWLRPIPPMVRCGGAPGLRCDRVARADVGYCFRCQQERARAVAA